MDHSWCPVCDCHVFASDNLYCSEACQRKDAASPSLVFVNDSKEKFYEFPRCSSQKPFQSPYASPNSSPMNSPLLNPMKDYFGTRDYSSKDYDLSTSPSTYLYNGGDLSPPRFTLGAPWYVNSSTKVTSTNASTSGLIPRRKPLRKKSSFTENARHLFFFWWVCIRYFLWPPLDEGVFHCLNFGRK